MKYYVFITALGLEINEEKTKFTIIQKELIPKDQNNYFEVEDFKFKIELEFKDLNFTRHRKK